VALWSAATFGSTPAFFDRLALVFRSTWNVAQPNPTSSNFGHMHRRQRLSSVIGVVTFSDEKTNPSGPGSCASPVPSFNSSSAVSYTHLKRDLGADALAKPAFAAEGEGKVLACSLTADLAKIRKDAVKVRDHFPGVTKMIFATHDTVALERSEQWAVEIQREFGYDLLVMEREEFVTSLMDPANASLLSSHLGLAVDLEPNLAEMADRVRAAASEVIDGWAKRSGPHPLIELRAVRVDEQGRHTTEILTLPELRQILATGGRLGLIGPAGQGKTTSLVQLGSCLLYTSRCV